MVRRDDDDGIFKLWWCFDFVDKCCDVFLVVIYCVEWLIWFIVKIIFFVVIGMRDKIIWVMGIDC